MFCHNEKYFFMKLKCVIPHNICVNTFKEESLYSYEPSEVNWLVIAQLVERSPVEFSIRLKHGQRLVGGSIPSREINKGYQHKDTSTTISFNGGMYRYYTASRDR